MTTVFGCAGRLYPILPPVKTGLIYSGHRGKMFHRAVAFILAGLSWVGVAACAKDSSSPSEAVKPTGPTVARIVVSAPSSAFAIGHKVTPKVQAFDADSKPVSVSSSPTW